MMMFPGAAFDVLFSTRYGWLVLPVFIVAGVTLAFLTQDAVDTTKDTRRAARDLWLSECSEPIQVCAAAWDDGWTLREIYVARVSPKD